MDIQTFSISCGMGKSNDWKQLNINDEQIKFLNKIGYCGEKSTGYSFESYLNEIHKEKYSYKVQWQSGDSAEFTDNYIVIRVKNS